MITLIVGGARSGKSSFAEQYCLENAYSLAYIATAQVLDDEMKDRVKYHQEMRASIWDTYEEPYDVAGVIKKISPDYPVILMDCLTLFITNHMLKDYKEDEVYDMDWMHRIETMISDELDKIAENLDEDCELVIVSNEVGMGIVSENFLARAYRDIAGRMNQKVSELADNVYFTVCGIPIKIKPNIEGVYR